MEAPKDQIAIQVVSGFLYGNVTEETTVRRQYLVCSVLHLPLHSDHASCPPVSGPGSLVHKELRRHILQSHRFQSRRNFLVPLCSLWSLEVGIKIAVHRQFEPLGGISDIRYNAFNGRGVVGAEVESRDVLLPISRHQLESDNIGSELL